MNKVEQFVYSGNKYNNNLREGYCAYRVWYSESSFSGYHQCQKKPVETIEGYGFCKQHANEVKGKLGLLEANLKAYSVDRFDFEIKEMDIVRATDSRVYLANGSMQNRDTQYETIFLDYESAKSYIINRLSNKIENAKAEIERYTKELAKWEQ